jgi:outer membrane protein assembly factor BamB/SAM-dependent methyltransferase
MRLKFVEERTMLPRVVLGALLALALTSPGRGAQSAAEIVEESGVQGGVVVHVGCGNGELTASLRIDDSFIVQGLDADPSNVQRARRHFRSLGLGGCVTAAAYDGRRLPYADNLVNLLVVSDPSSIAEQELLRVLCPGGAWVKEEGGRTKGERESEQGGGGVAVHRKPWPDDIDQWTHFLHGPDNNAVSRDRVVASPRCLQWVSDPVYGRHHDRLASVSAMVSAGGRLLTIEDRGPALSINLSPDWRLIARDAFNGVVLWDSPIDRWQSTRTGFRSGPVQLPRRLVAVDDCVFVAMNYGGPLICLDAATGTELKRFEGTDGVDEILFHDGTLYLAATDVSVESSRRILAVDAASGRMLWQSSDGPASSIQPATLAVGRELLFFHDGQAAVALDRTDGRVVWRTPLPSVDRRPSWLSPTVVFHDGVVLCGDRAVDYPPRWKEHRELLSGMLAHGGLALVTALSAEDGAQLWQTEAAECFHGAVDVFVIDDLVWASQGPARFFFERSRPILANELGRDFYIEDVTGRDLRTGAVARTVDAAEAFTLAHHHRCYRNKATERFIIMGRTGIEFINLEGGRSQRHNWTRGMCQYGVMPANGLLYTPPHPCTCYNASKLNGFFAYSSRREASWEEATITRLETGTVHERTESTSPASAASPHPPAPTSSGPSTLSSGLSTPDSGLSTLDSGLLADWPTYRCDNGRSGCVASPVADRPALAWSRDLSGKLSAPTSADGRVFVSDVDRHIVYALDLATGEELWSYVAGGRVDSPPTHWQGRVYFGSSDGSIECLDASDGTQVWRYFAAPQRASIVAWNQLESPWPIAGSVLVRDESVYALAGRSSYLDGGMVFLRLDARTGRPQQTRQIYSRDPETGRQKVDDVDDLYLSGLLYDIPSCIGDSIFVREARMSLDGIMIDEPQPHLYSVGGFLDDTWWHRFYMIYGTRFKNGPGGGLGRSGGAPYGRLLVYDDRHVYGYGEANPNRYHLFCIGKERAKRPPAGSSAGGGQRRQRAALPAAIWSDSEWPILVRALVLAKAVRAQQEIGGRLIVAGPPAAASTRIEVLRGEAGGLLAVVDAATGETVSKLRLDSTPVFDGMCAARGHVVVSLKSGAIVAFK